MLKNYSVHPSPLGAFIAKALEAESVDTVFGIVGSHVIGIYDGLSDIPTIRRITAKHEVGAAFMAAAYARTTGRTGVCVVTAGPGVLNAANGLAQAQFSALPVVMIAGSVPLGAPCYALHGLENESYTHQALASIVKKCFRPESPAQVSSMLAEAFALARSGRPGPVSVEIPWDLFQVSKMELAYKKNLPQIPLFDIHDADIAVAALATASDPFIIVDKPILHSPEREKFINSIPSIITSIAVTRDALGAIPDHHPCYAGVLHDHCFGSVAFDALSVADLCIAVGFDEGSQNAELINSKARKLVKLGWHGTVSEPDQGVTFDQLLSAFSDKIRHEPPSTTYDTPSEHRNLFKKLREQCLQHSDGTPLHFGYACAILANHLPEDAIVVLDNGSHEVWARSLLPVQHPFSIISGGDWASMGYGIPSATAIRTAFPDRTLVVVTGDGCLMMGLSDLATLIELGGRTIIVNLNDSAFGMMEKVQLSVHGRSADTKLPQIDFAKIAEACGATGIQVHVPRDLPPVYKQAFSSDQPVFIDLMCDTRVRFPRP